MKKTALPPPYEAQEQEALFEWASWNHGRLPDLDYMHAIPNGGSRHPAEAVRLQKQGVKPGVPDIFLPEPRGQYHGLYIEMKRAEKGKTSADQDRWLHHLASRGFMTAVCYSCDSATHIIEQYMKLPPFYTTKEKST